MSMEILWFFVAGAGLGIFSNAIKDDSSWPLTLGGILILAGIERIIDAKIKRSKQD